MKILPALAWASFSKPFPTMYFTGDYVIIPRTTGILSGRLGGMHFLPTVLVARCFRWGTENTSANLHSKFARCTVTLRGPRSRDLARD